MRPILSLVLLFVCMQTDAQTLADQRCATLNKGMNVSNWLEEYWNANWPQPHKYTKAHFETFAEAGITSIRLPINFHAVVGVDAPYDVDENHAVFEWVDSVIVWTDELNMKLLIDNHHGWELNNNTWRADLPRFSHMWSVVAQRYQHLDPERVFFELMNEPTILFDRDSLVIMYNDAIDSIRQHTTAHSIIVSPHYGGTAVLINTFEPLADTNLIYTWHVYDPLDFSHQGLTWHNPYFESGNPFPHTEPTFFEGWLYDGWQKVIDWKQTHQKPIFLGEFGLSGYCDSASVCNWLQYNAIRLTEHDIPWFYWDWQWDFSMFNSHVISEDSIYPCFKYYLGLYGDNTFTGLEESELVESPLFDLYPNPSANGEFTLRYNGKSTDGSTVAVYNEIGQMVIRRDLDSGQTTLHETLISGLYLVCIESETERTVKKLLVH